MPFSIYPTVQNRSGEIIGASIAGGAATLADDIIQTANSLQEKKGYQTILKALAQDPANGIDPATIDNLSFGQAKGKVAAAEITRAQRNRMAGEKALPGFLSDIAAGAPNNGPESPDINATLMQGRGPVASPITNRGPDAMKLAIINASRNPDILKTEIGQNVLVNAIKLGMVQPRSPTLSTLPSGRTMAIDPNGRVQFEPNAPQPRSTGRRPNAAADLTPGDQLFPYTPPGSRTPVPGLYKRVNNGKVVGYWQDPQSQTRGGIDWFSGNVPGGSGGAEPGSAAPAANRVRVTGPNGERGTIEEGDELPEGWTMEQ